VTVAKSGREDPSRRAELGVSATWLGVLSACFAVAPLIHAAVGQAVGGSASVG
jgi:hypothetical protein